MRRKSHYVTNLRQALPALLFAVAAGVIGMKVLGVSLAATYSSNPTGFADYCTVENNHTVLYGWAYDPEASTGDQPNVVVNVGSLSGTLPTNVTNYRITGINSWLDTYYSGAPKMGTYGWRWEISGLYKGGSYVVSGTVVNVGAGANVALNVNSGNDLSSEGPAKTIFTSDKKVPDACLATAPVTTPPVATPAPTKTTTPKKTTTTTPAPAAPAVPAPSSEANAQVITGTTGVTLNIPSGNAAKIHVSYGVSGKPAIATDDQVVSGDKTTLTLGNLSASTDYQYTIVRTNSAGVSTTSPVASLKTFGFVAQVRFSTADKKPVAGIVGTISDSKKTKATSNKDGTLTFSGLPDGKYTIRYTYKNRTFTTDVNTASNSSPQFNEDGTPKIITLTESVNVDKLIPATSSSKSKSHLPIAPIIFLLILVAGVIWFVAWRRRRKQQQLATEYGELSNFGSTTLPPTANIPPPATVIPAHNIPTSPLPAHAGESLRDMVILSMHDQAQHPAVPAPHAAQTVAERSATLPPQDPTPPPAQEHSAAPAIHKPAHTKPSHPMHDDDDRVIHIDHRKKIS